MKIKRARKTQKKLLDAFLSVEFLNDVCMHKSDFVEYFDNDVFTEDLDVLISSHVLKCDDVLSFCEKMFPYIFINEPPEGWLKYTYHFTLNKAFPHLESFTVVSEYKSAVLVLLKTIDIVFKTRKSILKFSNPNSDYYLDFLSEEETNDLYNPQEYIDFVNAFDGDYVYQTMLLHQELTNHTTHDHICGVHYIALNVGRQLKKAGLPIDLGRVSGAAAGHDIGKFGIRTGEKKRIPYLHYYYSDLWFKANKLDNIGHIAVNHSTWDLELENLPIESLVLIYSDFRSKTETKNGKKKIAVFTLAQAFNVILDKLDNVNEEKANRYNKVYAKLLDFENYMKSLGINTDIASDKILDMPKKHVVLMQGEDITENLKFKAIEHNIHLLSKLRNEASLSSMIEIIKSRNNWKHLRSYLNIFEEYSKYFTQKQKLITLNYLYELLTHPEEDIRQKAAELTGYIIANYDEKYRKEVPDNITIELPEIDSYALFDKYINLILYPDHKVIDTHKEWLGYNLRLFIRAFFEKCSEQSKSKYRDIFMKYLQSSSKDSVENELHIFQAIKFIPLSNCKLGVVNMLVESLLDAFNSPNEDIRLIALDRTDLLLRIFPYRSFKAKVKHCFMTHYTSGTSLAEKYIRCKISRNLGLCEDKSDWFSECFVNDYSDISSIFLKNLRTDISWIIKKYHIELMLNFTHESKDSDALYTAMHFCNLLKVSDKENVRINAGKALVEILTYLPPEQKNDVAIELLRSLEMESFEHSAYIPEYLAQVLIHLQPSELDQIIIDLYSKIKWASNKTVFLILSTIGYTIENYPSYIKHFDESKNTYLKRVQKMLGILLIGLTNYDDEVKEEAFTVIGSLLSSTKVTMAEKESIYYFISKKVLSLLAEKETNEMLFLNNSAALNHVYRFISDFSHVCGKVKVKTNNKIAFFPGSFDPFSLSHKRIASKIRDLGFELYLSVDEFSWSKSTQPHKQREKIVSMSIADEINMFIFPEDIPINITNSKDMSKLKSLFKDKEVYIVMGSDVIINASSYKAMVTEDSVHTFPHIIIKRKYSHREEALSNEYTKNLSKISADVIELELSTHYKGIRSTLIRDYIDDNRDISNLVDPLVQKYIYEFGLYLKAPPYKKVLGDFRTKVSTLDRNTMPLVDELCSKFLGGSDESLNLFYDLIEKKNAEILLLYDRKNDMNILGFSVIHSVKAHSIFSEFKDHIISEKIREHSIGRMIAIDGIYLSDDAPINSAQVLLSDTLANCLENEYTYAVYKQSFKKPTSARVIETLTLQGFNKLVLGGGSNIYEVDMSKPCTLNLDTLSFIKEPFRSNNNVIQAVVNTRKRLQTALTELFPGNLVISFEREALYNALSEKICAINNVSSVPAKERVLGPYMCVPFGQTLKGHVVPNTVTKSLHSEKIFEPNLSRFDIGQYPQYLSLPNQISTINSFDRKVILVDDILNKGYRINALMPLIENSDMKIVKIIVGVMSSRGKEIADMNGLDVDSTYFIPNMRNWFTEGLLYPYIGGDSIRTDELLVNSLLPSINLIFPYTAPSFIKDTSISSLFNLSRVCLENSLEIFKTLEQEYQITQERSLTLNQLSEVLESPRSIYKGKGTQYDMNRKTSTYLIDDLEHLSRLEKLAALG